MSDFRFELNEAGVRELLQSAEMNEIITAYTDQINAEAGEGYEGDVQTGKNRIVGMVKAVSKEAIEDNEENNTLLRAIGGG